MLIKSNVCYDKQTLPVNKWTSCKTRFLFALSLSKGSGKPLRFPKLTLSGFSYFGVSQEVYYVGGNLQDMDGNWVSLTYIPKAFQANLQDDEFNIYYDNNPFYFVARVPAYNYGRSGADWIVMLYEPISRIVLFTFDWS